jgi:hypothetical protein
MFILYVLNLLLFSQPVMWEEAIKTRVFLGGSVLCTEY